MEMIDGPRPNSIGEYGGDREFDTRYNAGSRDGECCRQIVRNAFVNVSSLVMRDRVPDSVARVWARNE